MLYLPRQPRIDLLKSHSGHEFAVIVQPLEHDGARLATHFQQLLSAKYSSEHPALWLATTARAHNQL